MARIGDSIQGTSEGVVRAAADEICQAGYLWTLR